ncbi:MAG: 2,3-bisphosphoglycerate-independent phosphoglycerate mutase [Sphingomonadales bacterium]
MNTKDSLSPARPRPVILCVLDGWGHRPDDTDNAIAEARTPAFDQLWRNHPHALLNTSGLAVGLPDGQMGNSEVGHMNLGGGRVVFQDLPRIDRAIADGELAHNPELRDLISALRVTGGVCHLMALASPGGVHSHQNHIVALARLLDADGIPVAIHAFLDGRDTPPESAARFVEEIISSVADCPYVGIATVIGRFYAMDRDQRWDRIEQAHGCMVEAKGQTAPDAVAAIRAGYEAGISDEFMAPTAIGAYSGMADGDAILMANFRADRVREILTALTEPEFDEFPRGRVIEFSARLGMVEYSDRLAKEMTALFKKRRLANTLGALVSHAGLKQLRISETEKYAHITFFFNGGEETVSEGEDRILVPSPKVATYDLQPEMSAVEVTDRLVDAIKAGSHDFIVVNYANPDMVGHTGDMAAAKTAIETVDACLARLIHVVDEAGGALLITADHGNAELMRDPERDQPHTAHTTNPVPLVLFQGHDHSPRPMLERGQLADVAPTLLEILALPQPEEMTGQSLLRTPAAVAQGGQKVERRTG